MPSMFSPGKIVRLEMENFKSYKGSQTIGPFYDFTAIIGPNGVGKSNLMDAISFVLGVPSKQLRGDQLKDLIYAFDDREKEQRGRRAFVRLVYQMDNGTALQFTRTITGSGGSEYGIDGKVVTWDEYNARLKSIGILVKPQNFLVFQGDVESIASKNPKELTALLEQISGSDELKKDYEDLEEQKARAEEKLALVYEEKRKVVMARQQKEVQKEEAQKYLRLQEQLKSLKKEHFLWQLFSIEKDWEKIDGELEKERRSLQDVDKEREECDFEVDAKKKEQAGYLKEMTICEKKIAKKKIELDKKQQELLNLIEEISRINSKIKSSNKELEKKKEGQRKHAKEIEKLQKDMHDVAEALNELNEQGQDGVGKLELTAEQLAEYNRVKAEAGMKTAKLIEEKEVLDRQLQADVEVQKNMEDNLQLLINRGKELSSQEDQMQTRHKKIVDAIAKLNEDLPRAKKELNDVSEQRQSVGTEYKSLKQRVDEIDLQLFELKADKHKSERDAQLSATVQSLKRLIAGVHGCMTEFCGTSQREYNLAVTVAMGKFMDAIVVEDANAGKECIQSVEKAVKFAVGNTLVCDGLEEAKELSRIKEVFKVVTIDGILLTKDGLVTGGTTDGIEDRSNKWDDIRVETLKREKEKHESDMEELGSLRELQSKESEASERITGLERKIRYSNIEEKNIQGKLSQVGKEKKNIEVEITYLKAELQELKGLITKKTEAIQEIEKRINEIIDRIYKDFSRSVGVSNIREYEENQLKDQQEMNERKLRLNIQMSKLKYQLEYEKKRDTKSPIAKLESSLTSLVDQLKVAQKKDSELAAEKAADLVEELKKEADGWKSKSDECENILKDIMKKNTSITGNIGKLKRQITSKETQLEQLPTVDDPMDTGSSTPGPVFDYNELSRSMQDMRHSDREKHEVDFKQKMATLVADIERIAPNLKALDQYEALRGKENEIIDKFEATRKEDKEISDKYNAVKQRRYVLFMAAFNHISKNIDRIYKQLTKGHTQPTGGMAHLTLENDDVPFLHGIRYTAIPPTQRFQDVERLSGGEKTVAALALLFSIHSYRPSPFFILDGVDAALDISNVAKVAGFIRSKSCGGSRVEPDADGATGFQSIVISLRDSFYGKAEALIAVYKDSSCSRTISLDLTKYEE